MAPTRRRPQQPTDQHVTDLFEKILQRLNRIDLRLKKMGACQNLQQERQTKVEETLEQVVAELKQDSSVSNFPIAPKESIQDERSCTDLQATGETGSRDSEKETTNKRSRELPSAVVCVDDFVVSSQTFSQKLELLMEIKLTEIVEQMKGHARGVLADVQVKTDQMRELRQEDMLWLEQQLDRHTQESDRRLQDRLQVVRDEICAQLSPDCNSDLVNRQNQEGLIESLKKEQQTLNSLVEKFQNGVFFTLGQVEGKILNTLHELGRYVSVELQSKYEVGSKLHQEVAQGLDKLGEKMRADSSTFVDNLNSMKIEISQKLSSAPDLTATGNLSKEMGSNVERILTSITSVKDDLMLYLRMSDNIHKCNFQLCMDKIQGVKKHTAVSSYNLDNVSKQVEALKATLEATKKRVVMTEESVLSELVKLKACVHEATEGIEDSIDRAKSELFAMAEKESQLVRDRLEGPLPLQTSYTFDFYLHDFPRLVGSSKKRFSCPWHIVQLKSSVRASVCFLPSGRMSVWLMAGRHPREAGLQPAAVVALRARASLSSLESTGLAEMVLGEASLELDENNISSDFLEGSGQRLAELCCQELTGKGYGGNTVLIRYNITVLSTF